LISVAVTPGVFFCASAGPGDQYGAGQSGHHHAAIHRFPPSSHVVCANAAIRAASSLRPPATPVGIAYMKPIRKIP